MGETTMIEELKITEKQFKDLYNTIKENNVLLPEYLRLKKRMNEVEKVIDENNGIIHRLMGDVPSYLSESSIVALYLDYYGQSAE